MPKFVRDRNSLKWWRIWKLSNTVYFILNKRIGYTNFIKDAYLMSKEIKLGIGIGVQLPMFTWKGGGGMRVIVSEGMRVVIPSFIKNNV